MPKIKKIEQSTQQIEDIVELRETVRDLPFIPEEYSDKTRVLTAEMIIDYVDLLNDSANTLVAFMDQHSLWETFYDWENKKNDD